MSDDNKIISLTVEQREKLRDLWNSRKENPPSLAELVNVNFPGLDGRSAAGMATKAALSEMQIKANSTTKYHKRTDDVEITEEIKTFINNNPGLTSLEIARTVFNNPNLTSLDIQSRAVLEYIRKNSKELKLPEVEEEIPEDYVPPRNFIETFARINKYIPAKLDKDKLTPGQKKEIEIVQSLLSDMRFIFTINTYLHEHERQLFEGEFIKSIYNKASDCSNEEVSQFMNLSGSFVTEIQYVSELNRYKEKAKIHLEESNTVPKNVSDRISSLEKNIVDIKNYQDKLVKSLQGERSKRMENRIAENSSMVALIQAWRSKIHRDRLIKYAQLKDSAVKKELDKLESMSAIKCSIFGINKNEIAPYEEENIPN